MAELERGDKERHSSWLENFYDLIVAIVVAQLAASFAHHITVYEYFSFVVLFIPVWWSWLGVTYYNTRFEVDDVSHRLLTLLQMAGAAFMAVSIGKGFDINSVGFALSYAAIRTILVVQYLLTGKRIPSARPLTSLYSKAFMFTTSIWFASAFVPEPFRFYLWGAGLVVDVTIPFLFTRKLSNRFAPHIYHLPDRFGAFTIIVLGISILAFVDNIATHSWTLSSIVSAALSLSVAFCLWWIYFDSIDGAAVRAFRRDKRVTVYFAWLYVHFPLLIGITGFGVSIEHLVTTQPDSPLPAGDKWLMCLSIAFCLFSLAVIRITSYIAESKHKRVVDRSIERTQAIYAIIAASVVLLVAVLVNHLLPLHLISIIAVALAGLVVLDIRHHPFHRQFKRKSVSEL